MAVGDVRYSNYVNAARRYGSSILARREVEVGVEVKAA